MKTRVELGHRQLGDKWKSPVVGNEGRGFGVGTEMKGQVVDWPQRQKDRRHSWILFAGGRRGEVVTDG